jgi:hypothetical protein
MSRMKAVALAATLLCALLGTLRADTSAAAACTTRWIDPVSGSWFDGTKWSGGTAPTAADVVCIDVDGTYTVGVSGWAVAQSLVLGAASGTQTLRLSGRCDRELNLSSTFGRATLTVGGSVAIGSTGAVELTSPPGITINPCWKSATLDVQADRLFTNDGTITASVGGGGARVLRGDLSSHGRVFVHQTLTLDRSGDRWHNYGSLTIGPSAQLLLAGGQTFWNTTGGSITGQGSLQVTRGSFEQGTGTFTATQPIVLEDSTLWLGSSAKARYRWRGDGSLSGNVAHAQSIELVGTCGKPARLSAIDGDGYPAAAFVNSGTIDLTTGPAGCAGDVSIAADMTNTGRLNVRAGAGGTRGIGGELVNEGRVHVEAGAWLGLDADYTQQATGRLVVGIASATSFGRLYPDEATVGGALEVERPSGFVVPPAGTVFRIVSVAGGVTGTWAAVHRALLSDGELEDTYLLPEFSPGTAKLVVRTASLDPPAPAARRPGHPVALAGHGWPGNALLDLSLEGASGTLPVDADPGTSAIDPVRTDADGSFALDEVNVPANATPGSAPFRARFAGLAPGLDVREPFTVTDPCAGLAGEDLDDDGLLDMGEDANGNGILDRGDLCLDGDGVASAGDGGPAAFDVEVGDAVLPFPDLAPDWFGELNGPDYVNDHGQGDPAYELSRHDALLVQTTGVQTNCPTAANGPGHWHIFDPGLDCVVVDLEHLLTNPTGITLYCSDGSCERDDYYQHFLMGSLRFHDRDGDGFWTSGEDLVRDSNNDGLFN